MEHRSREAHRTPNCLAKQLFNNCGIVLIYLVQHFTQFHHISVKITTILAKIRMV